MSKATVFVSGANGFIALHVVDELLKHNYRVIGSVRSEDKASKLREQFGNNANLTTTIVTDLSKPDSFDDAFAQYGSEIDVVLHTASPFHFNTTEYEKDLLIPAVHGTKAILEAIVKHAKNVKKVVVTSSLAAVGSLQQLYDPSLTLDEKTWNSSTWEGCQSDAMNAYCGSKKFAEKAAWDFVNEHKDEVKFTLATVNPSYVFGPQLFVEPGKKVLNTSSEVINQFVKSKKGVDVPEFIGYFIDVRDVAKAHRIAFEKDECVNKRLLLCSDAFTSQDILDICNSEFPELKGKIAEGQPGSGKKIHDSKSCKCNTSETQKLLGFKYLTLKESVVDSVAQILKAEQQSA